MTTHAIVVGNVGTVCTTTDRALALKEFISWTEISLGYTGRAAGEPVTWLIDGEPHKEIAGREVPHSADNLPDHEMTASQLAVKYSPNGDGEHPLFQRIDWQSCAVAGETIDSYWGWVRLRVAIEYEIEPDVTVHNFTVAATAPATLSRDEVLELLTLFCSAATQQLNADADESLNNDERERAAKALTMNVEVL